jgi:hypothetical protein
MPQACFGSQAERIQFRRHRSWLILLIEKHDAWATEKGPPEGDLSSRPEPRVRGTGDAVIVAMFPLGPIPSSLMLNDVAASDARLFDERQPLSD